MSGSRICGSILCPNVRVHSFCHVEQSILMPGVRVGRHARIKKAIIDRDVDIPRGALIGFNPEEDRRRHVVSEGGVVVVAPGDEPFVADIPVVTVQTSYPGASAETIEREVTERMEQAFNPVEGVDRITSQSLEGISLVTVEFELDRDPDVASQDIRSKIETIRRDLPADIDPPVVQKFDPAAQPIVSLALSSASTRPVTSIR